MNPAIPLVSSLPAEDTAQWQAALSAALPDYVIAPTSSLSTDERHRADVAIVANPDPAELQQLPRLRWLQSLWAGVDRLVAELPDRNLAIVRLIDPRLADAMAEAALTWALYLHRDGPRYRRQQQAGLWRQHPLPRPAERTIAVLGLGHLGRAAARRLRDHGFLVLGWSRRPVEIDGVTAYAGDAGLRHVLAQSQFVVVLLPLTSRTRGLLDAERLQTLPPGSGLINLARGPIIHEAALRSALDSGHIDHAVLDVFDVEPLPPDHWLWTHSSVTVLPHVGAPTSKETACRVVRDNIERYYATGVIPPSVDRARGY